MHTIARLNLKWRRLIFVLLATLILADTVPHPQLSPGLLRSLTTHVQNQFGGRR
ncbi:MAG: hypothetical protein ACFCVB_01990 [Nodosilinea sp.]